MFPLLFGCLNELFLPKRLQYNEAFSNVLKTHASEITSLTQNDSLEKIFPSPLLSGADLENDLVAAALIKSSSPRVPLLDLLDGLIDSLMEILGDFGNAEANSTKPASLVSIPWTGFGVVTNWKAVSSPNFNEHLAARERAEQKFRPWLRGLTYNSAGKVSSSGLVGCAALILRELAISSENIPMMCPSASKGIQPLLGTKNVVPQTSAGSSQPSDPSLAEVGGNETADEATDDMEILVKSEKV